MYRSRAVAESAAPATMLHTYDQPAATCKYQSVKVSAADDPVCCCLSRIFGEGNDKVFDLGGHLGHAYYGFSCYLEYPDGLEWRVQDVPAVVEAGRQRALTHDPDKRLTFTNDFTDADGCDVLITTGALQYLETSLPEMLQGLVVKPTHVLVNMVPMRSEEHTSELQSLLRIS